MRTEENEEPMSTNPYDYGVDVRELISGYRELYTGAVYDVLDEHGFPDQALAPGLRPLRNDMVLAGPVFTVKGIPDATADEQLRERRIHMFHDMAATGVPLIDVRDCSGDTQVAHYGEMNATVGETSGVLGAVVDGGCRDTSLLLRKDFPVMCRYFTPVEAYKRWSYYEWQRTIALRGATSSVVKAHPGDFILGDVDGAVVVPRDMVVDVLRKTQELVRTEDSARAAFTSDRTPADVYAEYGKL